MCTVTLSYDGNNAQAREQLAALLATGLFREDPYENGFQDMSHNIPEFGEGQKEDEDFPIPKDKTLTIDELEKLVVDDIRNICAMKDAV